MKPSEILRAAKALIGTEKTWTTGVSARNAQGEPCDEQSEEAVRWCAIGAFDRQRNAPAQKGLFYLKTREEMWFLAQSAKELYLARAESVNDHLGHKAVHKMYDRAIELAEKNER